MKQKFTAQEITTMALLAALLCVSSYISLQLPISAVPITAQTIIINLIAILLTPKKAGTTVLVWILLGIVGLPVFSGGKAGIGVILGPTGGYIIGYLVAAVLISFLIGKKYSYKKSLILILVVGIPVIYIVGTPWLKIVAGLDWKGAMAAGVLPFIPGDILKCIVAATIAKPLFGLVNKDR